ncbi:hypothetical protein BDZ94DRAFT_1261654 [Collybia nuda]|uniref:Uncharacterized protein n=1 Tax=Collybia nuda TaxID=64659 RepID=A0A9P5Y4Z6_9AGAR|nr:hypothetical protein BDZ94DRAFT_1261654 [Collybia nuda]
MRYGSEYYRLHFLTAICFGIFLCSFCVRPYRSSRPPFIHLCLLEWYNHVVKRYFNWLRDGTVVKDPLLYVMLGKLVVISRPHPDFVSRSQVYFRVVWPTLSNEG